MIPLQSGLPASRLRVIPCRNSSRGFSHLYSAGRGRMSDSPFGSVKSMTSSRLDSIGNKMKRKQSLEESFKLGKSLTNSTTKRRAHSLALLNSHSKSNLVVQKYSRLQLNLALLEALASRMSPRLIWYIIKKKCGIFIYMLNKFTGTTSNPKYRENSLTFSSLIICTVVTYLIWDHAMGLWGNKSDANLLVALWSNFSLSIQGLQEGKVWQPLTSSLMHLSLGHLIGNMSLIALIGGTLLSKIGYRKFLALYFGAGAAGNLFYLAFQAYAEPWLEQIQSKAPGLKASNLVGASTSFFALLATLYCATKHQPFFALSGIILSIRVLTPMYLAKELWLIYIGPEKVSASKDQIVLSGHTAHVGGAIAGYLFWRTVLRGVRFK